MNNLDKQYQDLLKDILENGVVKSDRTGTGTQSVFGRTIRHKMSEGFPLITTKKMYLKGIITELIWFLRGDTNIKWLIENKCNIWNGDAYKKYTNSYASGIYNSAWSNNGEPWGMAKFIELILEDEHFCRTFGDLGPIYGAQWRRWNTNRNMVIGHTGTHNVFGTEIIDQIYHLVNDLKKNPDSRRLMVSAWNPAELSQMTLPPCHYGFQCYTRLLTWDERLNIYTAKGEEYNKLMETDSNGIMAVMDAHNIPTRALSLMWNQRSVDTFLGLPFNIASYGLLLEILAKMSNMVPDELIGNLGDTHLYLNHLDKAKLQLERDSYELPTLTHMKTDEFWANDLNTIVTHLDNLDFLCEFYKSHPAIVAELSN